MAKQDTFYFSHDYNVRQDSKIRRLLAKHGMVGYGVFWAIIEDLYNNANALPTNYDVIAYDIRTDENMVKSVINDFELFIVDGDKFGSGSVQRRLEERQEKSKKATESANKRWGKDANALQSNSERKEIPYDSNAIKERKVKENKENIKKEFDLFWNLYGKKRSHEKCFSKFEKLSDADRAKIFETLPAYVASTPNVEFRKDPTTYLNNKSWNDEIITSTVSSDQPKKKFTIMNTKEGPVKVEVNA